MMEKQTWGENKMGCRFNGYYLKYLITLVSQLFGYNSVQNNRCDMIILVLLFFFFWTTTDQEK